MRRAGVVDCRWWMSGVLDGVMFAGIGKGQALEKSWMKAWKDEENLITYVKRSIRAIHAFSDNLAVVHEDAANGCLVGAERELGLQYDRLAICSRQENIQKLSRKVLQSEIHISWTRTEEGPYHFNGLTHEFFMVRSVLHVCIHLCFRGAVCMFEKSPGP